MEPNIALALLCLQMASHTISNKELAKKYVKVAKLTLDEQFFAVTDYLIDNEDLSLEVHQYYNKWAQSEHIKANP